MKLSAFFIAFTIIFSCAKDTKKRGNSDQDPGFKACTLLGAIGSTKLEFVSTSPIPPKLVVQSNGQIIASDCNENTIDRIDRDGDKVVLFSYDSNNYPAQVTYDIYSITNCADENTQVLLKDNLVIDIAYANETVYPNGPKCPSQDITNGVGEINLD